MESGKVRLKDASPTDWIRCKYCQCFISTSSFVGHREQHRKEKMKAPDRFQNGWLPTATQGQVRIKQEIPIIDLANSDEEEVDGFLAYAAQQIPIPISQPPSPPSPGLEGESDEFGSDLNLLKCEECGEYFFTRLDYDKHNAMYHSEGTSVASEPLTSLFEGAESQDSLLCTKSGNQTLHNDCSQVVSPLMNQLSGSLQVSSSADVSEVFNFSTPPVTSAADSTHSPADDNRIIITSKSERPERTDIEPTSPNSEKSERIDSEPTSPMSEKSENIDSEPASPSPQSSRASPNEMQDQDPNDCKKPTKRKKYPQIQEYYVQRAAAKKSHRYNENVCPYCDKDCQTTARWESHVQSKHERKGNKKSRSEEPEVLPPKQPKVLDRRRKTSLSPKSTEKDSLKKVWQKPREMRGRPKINMVNKSSPVKASKKGKALKEEKLLRRFQADAKKQPSPTKTSRFGMVPNQLKPQMFSTVTRAQCQYCKVWISKQGLKYHVRVHTGEKPFSCKYCATSFRGRPSWLRHENLCRDKLTVIMPNNQKKKIRVRAPSSRNIQSTEESCPSRLEANGALTKTMPTTTGNQRGVKRKPTEMMAAQPTKLRALDDQAKQTHSDFQAEKLYMCEVCDFATFRNSELDLHMKDHETEKKRVAEKRNAEVSKDSSVINNLRSKITATAKPQSKLQSIKADGLNQNRLLRPTTYDKEGVDKGTPLTSLNSYRCLMCLRVYGGESVIREHIKVFHGQTLQTVIRTDEDPSLGKRILKLAKKVSSISIVRTGTEAKQSDPLDPLECIDEKLPRLVVKIQGEHVAACSVLCPRRTPLSRTSDKDPFPCEFCSEKFLTHEAYLLHVIHHKGAAIRSCNQCGKTFLHSEFFQQHMREVHKVSVTLRSPKNISSDKMKAKRKELAKCKLKEARVSLPVVSLPRCDAQEVQTDASINASGIPETSREKDSAASPSNYNAESVPRLETDTPVTPNSKNETILNQPVKIQSFDCALKRKDGIVKDCVVKTASAYGEQSTNAITPPSFPTKGVSCVVESGAGLQNPVLAPEIQQQPLTISIPTEEEVQSKRMPYSVAADPISPPLTGELNPISPAYLVRPTSVDWFPAKVMATPNKSISLKENGFTNLEMLSLIATLEPRSSLPIKTPEKPDVSSCESTLLTATKPTPENGHIECTNETLNNNNNDYSGKSFESVIKTVTRDRQSQPATTNRDLEQFKSNVNGERKTFICRRQCPYCCVNYQSQLALDDHVAKTHSSKDVSSAAFLN